MTQSHPLTWTAAEIIEATQGEILCGDMSRPFTGVGIDSRNISADDIFVAITGEVHDGHKNVAGRNVAGINDNPCERTAQVTT